MARTLSNILIDTRLRITSTMPESTVRVIAPRNPVPSITPATPSRLAPCSLIIAAEALRSASSGGSAELSTTHRNATFPGLRDGGGELRALYGKQLGGRFGLPQRDADRTHHRHQQLTRAVQDLQVEASNRRRLSFLREHPSQ